MTIRIKFKCGICSLSIAYLFHLISCQRPFCSKTSVFTFNLLRGEFLDFKFDKYAAMQTRWVEPWSRSKPSVVTPRGGIRGMCVCVCVCVGGGGGGCGGRRCTCTLGTTWFTFLWQKCDSCQTWARNGEGANNRVDRGD